MRYDFYILFAAILTAFIAWATTSKLGLPAKFVFLCVAIGLLMTVAVGASQ